MGKIVFKKLNDWAVIPERPNIEKVQVSKNQDLRWIENNRVKGACYPYRMASNLGWIIKSPIDVDVYPVEEKQVKCEPQELEEIGSLLDINFWVKRQDIYIGVKPDGWFRIHQAKVNDNWHNLFIPNGEGSFEWRLGWNVQLPDDYVLMFLPLFDENNFKVHPGILTKKSLNKFDAGLGISIAFEPIKKFSIKRNMPLGRMVIFHKSALSLKTEIVGV